MSNLYIREQYVNATEGHIFGESGMVESFTNDIGVLFRDLKGEYGNIN